MNWFKNYKSKNLSSNSVTLAKNGLYFNQEATCNLKLHAFAFAQVSLTDDNVFYVQFTKYRVNDATNYKVVITDKGAAKVHCIQFVNIYFNARNDVKHCGLRVIERDAEHLLIRCILEEEYKNV